MNGLIEIGDKVVLYGFFNGFTYETDGATNGLVALETGERVEIPLGGIMKKDQIITKKDVISRMKQLFPNNRIDWINGILHEFGDEFGLWKYKAGYEQGKLEGIMEREKPVVKQFVADWYEKHKNNIDFEIWHYLHTFSSQEEDEFKKWMNKLGEKQIQTLVNMHQFGYEVEKEKRYRVKMKDLETGFNFLNYCNGEDHWIFSSKDNTIDFRSLHTRKELEEAGFGEVFNSPLFEVEEVEG